MIKISSGTYNPNDTAGVDEKKQIVFSGKHNKYQMKKVQSILTIQKENVFNKKINPDELFIQGDSILPYLYTMEQHQGEVEVEYNDTCKIIKKQLDKKINGYKQQDLLKNVFLPTEFVDIATILQMFRTCNAKCYYCSCDMIIMYKFVREPTQWTIDRIDNIKGHNKNNIVLACLKCNLSRKCRSEQSFKMTKQMNLVLLNKNVGDNPDVGVGDCKSDLTENLVCGEIVEN
jgi:hypothetical protein